MPSKISIYDIWQNNFSELLMQNDGRGIISNAAVSAENSYNVYEEFLSMIPEEIKFCEASLTDLSMMRNKLF